MTKKNILFVLGTRPEAIKLAPVIKTFQQYSEQFETKLCVTAQHREMLDQVLNFFELSPDYDLDVMKIGQSLTSLSSEILKGMDVVMNDFSPDYVFVQGDTTSCLMGALSAFYSGAKVCHVEAGLRTYNKYSPYPEEINRQLTTKLADIHFAPTEKAKQNLLVEGVDESTVLVTGNTVIDALKWGLEKSGNSNSEEIQKLKTIIDPDKKLVLVTGHRRENFGAGFQQICEALKELASEPGVQIIYPVHLNPNVQEPVHRILGTSDNVDLIDPLSYESFIWLMNEAHLILTDSGGIQEEAPSLGKPVLVLRATTERPEAIESGTAKLVGTDKNRIVEEAVTLINDESIYAQMSSISNPYGDGDASERIVNFLSKS